MIREEDQYLLNVLTDSMSSSQKKEYGSNTTAVREDDEMKIKYKPMEESGLDVIYTILKMPRPSKEKDKEDLRDQLKQLGKSPFITQRGCKK